MAAPNPTAPTAAPLPARPSAARGPTPHFDFARDTFAFPNELVWDYRPDPDSGRMSFRRRDPPPTYAHRCFVLARAARQFHLHAQFDPAAARATPDAYRRLARAVLARSPRRASDPAARVVIPGYAGLRAFSVAYEHTLKRAGGGAWRSYVLRSHWRMVFPISRRHQAATARQLEGALARGDVPVVHLVRFPQLTINHGLLLFDVASADRSGDRVFAAYDPNVPERPATLAYAAAARTFRFPANHYWAGGPLEVIHIFRGWAY